LTEIKLLDCAWRQKRSVQRHVLTQRQNGIVMIDDAELRGCWTTDGARSIQREL
jgi:hypothetical protein